MDVVYLSERELRALAEMDKTLGREPFLIRHLRGRRLALWVSALAFVSVCLLGLDVVFRTPLLTVAFVVVWAITLTGLVGLVVRWSHRWKRQVTIRI